MFWLDTAGNSWQPSAHDHYSHLGGRARCWGDHPEPMGLAAAARAWGQCCVCYGRNRTWPWRHTHSVSCGGVYAGYGRRPRLAVTFYLANLVKAVATYPSSLLTVCSQTGLYGLVLPSRTEGGRWRFYWKKSRFPDSAVIGSTCPFNPVIHPNTSTPSGRTSASSAPLRPGVASTSAPALI